jgi:hypothetical protein
MFDAYRSQYGTDIARLGDLFDRIVVYLDVGRDQATISHTLSEHRWNSPAHGISVPLCHGQTT